MDEKAIEEMYDAIMSTFDGRDYDSIMVVLGAVHNYFALQTTTDPDRLRMLYNMMGDAAICMAMLEEDDGRNQLQATQDPPQKTKRKKTRKKTGDEPGPFGTH